MEMKITIKHHVPSTFCADKYQRTLAWDATASDMIEAMAGLLLSMGYAQVNVLDAMEEYVGERR